MEKAEEKTALEKAREHIFSNDKSAIELRNELFSSIDETLDNKGVYDLSVLKTELEAELAGRGISLTEDELRNIFWGLASGRLKANFRPMIEELIKMDDRGAGEEKMEERLHRELFGLLKKLSGTMAHSEKHGADLSELRDRFEAYALGLSETYRDEGSPGLARLIADIGDAARKKEDEKREQDKQKTENAKKPIKGFLSKAAGQIAGVAGARTEDIHFMPTSPGEKARIRSKIPFERMVPGLVVKVEEEKRKSTVKEIGWYQFMGLPHLENGTWIVRVKMAHHLAGIPEKDKFVDMPLEDMGIIPGPDGEFDKFNVLLRAEIPREGWKKDFS